MTESKKAMAIAAGLAGVAGAATLAVAPNQVSAATGTVTYADGATTVWQQPAFQGVKRYVVKDQKIAITGQKTVNGTTWYQIGQNEWIPEIYLQVDGAAADNSTANATTTTATASVADSFDVAATYTEGAVTIWNNTNYASASGRYMTATSNLKAVATVQANGETWYKLADGGYVPARFSAPAGSKQAAQAATAATSTATTATATTSVASSAASAAPAADTTTTTGKTADDTATTATTAQTTATSSAAPAAATSTATSAAATTTTSAAATTATPKTAATTATASQSLTVTYTDSVVTEWKSAGYTQAAGKYLSAGTTVTAVGTTTANGETWYQLSDGNYIAARFVGDAGKANSNQMKTTTTTAAQTPASSAAATPAPAPAPAATPAKAAAPAKTTPAKAATPAKTTTATKPAATTTPVATTNNASRSAKIAAVIKVAKAQLGKPYVWGGKGPSSFDCSGLAHYAYLNGANKEIGGYTGAQEYSGTVVSIANLQVGDLVFWGSRGSTYHVAIYLGGNQYINAPKPGQNVQIASISKYFMPSFGVRVL
ncbi:C40 family peptidase [Lacticaseibacillus jixiensis]|uniref:C40 family peptidase n=1 Tax=Lacticaseibacillus jixiensis TaxID=3231926 RepID=UPI0036F22774